MRPSKLWFWLTVLSLVLAALWLVMAWANPPSGTPVARIDLIGYTNLTLTSSSANSRVYPGPGSWLCAQMMVTNAGSVSITYWAWSGEPQGNANAQTEQGITNGYLAPGYTGSLELLRPGCSTRFWVLLPTNTLRWDCSFGIATASPRARVFEWMFQRKWPQKYPEYLFYPIYILPYKPGREINLKSQMYEVSSHALSLTSKVSNAISPGP